MIGIKKLLQIQARHARTQKCTHSFVPVLNGLKVRIHIRFCHFFEWTYDIFCMNHTVWVISKYDSGLESNNFVTMPLWCTWKSQFDWIRIRWKKLWRMFHQKCNDEWPECWQGWQTFDRPEYEWDKSEKNQGGHWFTREAYDENSKWCTNWNNSNEKWTGIWNAWQSLRRVLF